MKVVMAVAVAGALAAGSAHAGDVQVGPRFSVSDDADLGVGADVRWQFLPEDRRLALTGSFDYFFPEDLEDATAGRIEEFLDLIPDEVEFPFEFDRSIDAEYWEANLNLTWDFTTERPVIPYVGVGANYGRSRTSAFGFDTDDSDVGANVLAGIRIRDRFYVEAKREAGGGDLFVVTAGVRF